MKKEQGITLIALVVTIVVLLILAGVSISMLTGENGIVTQAGKAKDETEQARVQELVDLAVNSLIGENMGSTSGITPQMVAEEVNEMENRDDVYAEGSEFPTKIIFPEEGREVEVNLEQKEDSNEMYEIAVEEEDIAPTNLFDYEIIDEAEMGALTLSALPTKKARITRIKEEYCNGYQSGDSNTHYEIIYEGSKISDTLIIPYKVDGKYIEGGIEGEMYIITEVQLQANGRDGFGFPRVETLIYPNTVEMIYGMAMVNEGSTYRGNDTLKTVILPNKLKTIGDYVFSSCLELKNVTIPDSVTSIGNGAFCDCSSLTNITIPDSVTSIGNSAFKDCSSLTNITIPDSVTGIGNSAFNDCSSLTNITIPESVTSIGASAFEWCSSLTNITIPESVTSIGNWVFYGWTDEQIINVPFKEGETPEGWDEDWKEYCEATINYLK